MVLKCNEGLPSETPNPILWESRSAFLKMFDLNTSNFKIFVQGRKYIFLLSTELSLAYLMHVSYFSYDFSSSESLTKKIFCTLHNFFST